MRVLITGFGPFPGAPFNPSAALAKALACRRRPALAGIERVDAYIRDHLRVGRSRSAKTVRAKTRCRADVRRRRAQASALHRDAGAQRRLAAVSRCQRVPAAPRRHKTSRTGGARRQRAIRAPCRRGRAEGTAVARCRQLSVQLRLLAGLEHGARHPAAGAIRSHPAGQRQAAAAPTLEQAADARPTSEIRRSAAHRTHRRKPPLTVNAGTSRAPH